MSYPPFKSAKELASKVDAYFNYIEGEYHLETVAAKGTKQTETLEQKVTDREAEPATITGLALHLGFSSRQAFDDYEQTGRFATVIKRGRLRVEAAYEKNCINRLPEPCSRLKTSAGKKRLRKSPPPVIRLPALK